MAINFLLINIVEGKMTLEIMKKQERSVMLPEWKEIDLDGGAKVVQPASKTPVQATHKHR